MFNIWDLTTFRTKNLVKVFFDIKNDYDLQNFLDKLSDFENFFVFGWGSNLLFKDDVYENLVFVRYFKRWIEYLWNNLWRVSGWENLSYFVKFLFKKWIVSLNPLFGLPWTIAGAVVWNAWSLGVEIWRFVKTIKLLDLKSREIIDLDEWWYKYCYRRSNLKELENIIVLEVVLEIDSRVWNWFFSPDYYVRRRLEKQPHWRTCWSYFKNIKMEITEDLSQKITEDIKKEISEDYSQKISDDYSRIIDYLNSKMIENIRYKLSKQDIVKLDEFVKKWVIPTGWLIEKAWLKWYDIWWVKVSEKHANFFINYNNKSWEKIYKLGEFVKEKVYNTFWVELQEEVVIV